MVCTYSDSFFFLLQPEVCTALKAWNCMLGVIDAGAELGASIYGAELPATSASHLRRAQNLGVRDTGAETC